MKTIKVKTILLIGGIILGLVLAVLAFSTASNSLVGVNTVLLYFIISGLSFGLAAYAGLSSEERWKRFTGVATVVAAVYMVVMGIVFVRLISSMDLPEEYVQPYTRPDTYEAPPTLAVPDIDG